jgi:anti-sigma factor RsiW
VTSGMSDHEMAELCALADGTLPAERRAAVEARVAASPELQELLERQRRAVAATRALDREPTPASLRAAVGARSKALPSRRRQASRLVPRLAAAGALAAMAVVLALVLSGGPGAPSVAEAAQFASRPPSGPAPPPLGESGTQLDVDVEAVTFPDLARSYGWRAVGVRRGRVDGRDAITVFYEKDGRRIAYAIVAGSGLPRPSDAQDTVLNGVLFQTLRVDNRLVVTWRRQGLTCVLIGEAAREELLTLANWRGNGTLRY